MKSLITILKQKPVFLNDWEGESSEKIFKDFDTVYDHSDGAMILFASYTYEDYSGDAFVLFTKNGKLYEVNGGHCSCNGLEGQWSPEEVNLKELEKRLQREPSAWYNKYDEELRKFLGIKYKNESN